MPREGFPRKRGERIASVERSRDISLSKNNLTHMTRMTYDCGFYETNQKTLDQTDAENRADFFRVHLLRWRGLISLIKWD
jgi:hypothetical protein